MSAAAVSYSTLCWRLSTECTEYIQWFCSVMGKHPSSSSSLTCKWMAEGVAHRTACLQQYAFTATLTLEQAAACVPKPN